MKYFNGNIWELYDRNYIVAIPTNIGWTKSGYNVMGRGLAFEASQKFDQLAKKYGEICKQKLESANFWYYSEKRIICLATKSLNKLQPNLSWKSNSTIWQIETSCKSLVNWIEMKLKISGDMTHQIAIPMLGCGNGGLKEEDVLPILEKHFSKYDFITLVQL